METTRFFIAPIPPVSPLSARTFKNSPDCINIRYILKKNQTEKKGKAGICNIEIWGKPG
jgi:hypothetical protein